MTKPWASSSLRTRRWRALTARDQRDGKLFCHWCAREVFRQPGETRGHPHTATIDHVIPRSRGGTNDLSNLVIACSPCNHKRGRSMPTFTVSPDVLTMTGQVPQLQPQSEVLLVIRPDGRIEIGPGLSPADATQRAAKMLIDAYGQAMAETRLVKFPRNADEAEMMARVALDYLREHAPERLRPAANDEEATRG